VPPRLISIVRAITMRTLTTVFLCILIPLVALADDCKPPLLSDEALRLVKPLLEVRIKESKEQFTEGGSWLGESQYTPEVGKRFYSVLQDRSSAGDEAVAYLLNVYMGEHLSEATVCEALNRGTRILPLIREYRRCSPLIGLEPLPRFVQGSGVLPGYAEEGILKGRKCRYD